MINEVEGIRIKVNSTCIYHMESSSNIHPQPTENLIFGAFFLGFWLGGVVGSVVRWLYLTPKF